MEGLPASLTKFLTGLRFANRSSSFRNLRTGDASAIESDEVTAPKSALSHFLNRSRVSSGIVLPTFPNALCPISAYSTSGSSVTAFKTATADSTPSGRIPYPGKPQMRFMATLLLDHLRQVYKVLLHPGGSLPAVVDILLHLGSHSA